MCVGILVSSSFSSTIGTGAAGSACGGEKKFNRCAVAQTASRGSVSGERRGQRHDGGGIAKEPGGTTTMESSSRFVCLWLIWPDVCRMEDARFVSYVLVENQSFRYPLCSRMGLIRSFVSAFEPALFRRFFLLSCSCGTYQQLFIARCVRDV